MKKTVLDARAKINLSLDVTARRPDGYHDVCMLMQTIELGDTVTVEVIDQGIEVYVSNAEVPAGQGNIAFKAAALFLSEAGISKGISISIEKRIPVAAGLAGGSTDAAAVLKAMNQLFEAGFDIQGLMDMGKKVGADVPFCILGGTALAEGIGEILTPLPSFSGFYLLLVRPRISVSTAWVYGQLKLEEITLRPDTGLLLDAVRSKKLDILAGNMRNVLEEVTIPSHPKIAHIKQRLLSLGAAGSMMSGSGPTVFGLFSDRSAAESAFKVLQKENTCDCFLTRTI